jgi:hypothetical protein
LPTARKVPLSVTKRDTSRPPSSAVSPRKFDRIDEGIALGGHAGGAPLFLLFSAGWILAQLPANRVSPDQKTETAPGNTRGRFTTRRYVCGV